MPVPNNVVRVNIRATVGPSEEIVHTLHFVRVNTTATEDPTLQQIANEVRNRWQDILTVFAVDGSTLASLLRTDLLYKTVDAYALSPAGLATSQAQALFAGTAKGSSSQVPLPPEVALVVSLKTEMPGRSGRGRLYMGGFDKDALFTGGLVKPVVQDTVVQALATFGNTMKMPTGAGTDRLNWVVLSRTKTMVNRIVETRVGDLWDVQRRRQNALFETFDTAPITY